MDVVPTLIGPRERGRPRQAGSAAGDDALWGPRRGPRSANKRSVESPLSPSSARREWAGGGHRGTWDNFSLKLVNARVIKDSAISSAAYVNVAQIDGYVPGMGMFLPEEGAWSVAFSFGPCEAGRLRAIARLFRDQPPLEAPRQPPVASIPLVDAPLVARAGVGPDPPSLAPPSLAARARVPGRVTRVAGPGNQWRRSPDHSPPPPEPGSGSSLSGDDVLIEDLD